MTTYIKTTPEPISVLDKGYVRLVDTLGDDLSVVNAARVSYGKFVAEMMEADVGLINYLMKNRQDRKSVV